MKHDHNAFAAPNAATIAYADPQVVARRVKDFLPMVHKAAWHIYGSGRDGLEVEDLVQIGLLTLTECARRHDRPTEDGFAAYAKMRVRGAMFDHLRKMALDTRSAIRRQRLASEARATYHAEHGRMPDDAQLAAALGVEVEDILSYSGEQLREVWLDDSYADHQSAFVDPGEGALEQLLDAENSALLAKQLAALPERLQMVLQLYFVEELNLAEIAATLDVSVPRVHQLKAQALAKLRSALEDIDA